LKAKVKEVQSTHQAKLKELETKDIEPAIMVIPEQNMKEYKKAPVKVADNLAAQVPKPFSQLGQFLTDDDDANTGRAFAVNPDSIGLMSDGTKAPSMPEATARTVDNTKSFEPCANAAKASMTSYKDSKTARTRTGPPEVAREVTEKEDVTKTAVQQHKGECDPESDLPCSRQRRRFMEPPDKLPMPASHGQQQEGPVCPAHQDHEA
jgi:hypothetical protein